MTTPLPPTASAPDQSNDKLWIILSHLSLFLGVAFLLPLIIYLVKRQDSQLITAHAAEALNFHISILIYIVCCMPLVFLFIGIPLLLILSLMACICAIIAAIKASEGGFYRYPLTIRFVH